MQIAVQLVNPTTEGNLWADRYERELRDVLSLQASIVSAIARAIRLRLSPEEESRLARSHRVQPAAYEAYLKGRFNLNRMTKEGFEVGLRYLHQAVEEDPTDALAYAGLALGYSQVGHDVYPDAFARARAAAAKALQLDPSLAELHEAEAEIKLYNDWDLTGAEQDFRRALEANPILAQAHAHHAWLLQLTGRYEESLAAAKRSVELDPLTALYSAWYGWIFTTGGQTEEAKAQALKSLEIIPDFHWGLFVLGLAHAQEGNYEAAIAAHQKAAESSPRVRWALGLTYAKAGREQEARSIAAELSRNPTPMDAWGLALVHGALGDREQALDWIDKGIELRFAWMPWIRDAEELRPLRGDARFEELIRRISARNAGGRPPTGTPIDGAGSRQRPA